MDEIFPTPETVDSIAADAGISAPSGAVARDAGPLLEAPALVHLFLGKRRKRRAMPKRKLVHVDKPTASPRARPRGADARDPGPLPSD